MSVQSFWIEYRALFLTSAALLAMTCASAFASAPAQFASQQDVKQCSR